MPSIVWKGHLTFGLISIPVKLFRAARRERLRLHYVHRPEPAEPPASASMSARDDDRTTTEAGAHRFEAAPPKVEPEAPPPTASVSRVRQSLIPTGADQPISRTDVLRGY